MMGQTFCWFLADLYSPSIFGLDCANWKQLCLCAVRRWELKWGMERVCSKISEHHVLGTRLGTLQMFWNNQHAKASTEIPPPSPEQKARRGRCRDNWPVYQHHSDSLRAKSQCLATVCIKSMYNSGISCCCTQENALQKWSTGWWQ